MDDRLIGQMNLKSWVGEDVARATIELLLPGTINGGAMQITREGCIERRYREWTGRGVNRKDKLSHLVRLKRASNESEGGVRDTDLLTDDAAMPAVWTTGPGLVG